MSNAPQEVTITFRGDASQLVAASQQVAASLRGVGAATQGMSTRTVAAGVAMGNVLTMLSTRVLGFGREALSSFETMGKEVYKMQLVVGGTAEEMSKLRYVSQMVGIDSAQVARGLGIASGAIAHNSDKWKQLGIAAKDASGETRPWTELLPEISDKFRALGGSIDRTAAMKQIFGRGFAAVEPLMDLGSDALRRFGEEAERVGLVMSQDDVDAARELAVQSRMLKANFQSLFVSIGRELLPVLGALVNMLTSVADKIRQVWNDGGALSTALKATAAVVGGFVAALLLYKSAMTVASVATNVFKLAVIQVDGALAANPIGIVILAIVALIAAVVWAAKTHKEWGDVFVAVSGAYIEIMGKQASLTIRGFQAMAWAVYHFIEVLASAKDALKDFAMKAAGVFGPVVGFVVDKLFPGGDSDSLRAVADKIKGFEGLLGDAADWAWDAGKNWTEKWGKGVWDALGNLKVPSLKDLLPDWSLPTGELVEVPAGGASPVEEQKKRILDFFTNLVKTSRDALNALRQAAVDARKQMQDESRKIAQTLRDSLNVTDMVSSTWAKYLGINALMRGFRRKLDQMKQFVADIRTLKRLGLPTEMLAQIANAGVEGGAAAARLLVQNPESISELQKIQQEITTVTAQAGEYVAGAVYGEEATLREKQALAAQLQFRGYLDAAKQIGYAPTAEDVSAYNADIRQEVTINATTMADAKQIADAVAWALKTGIALGMTPAPSMMGAAPTGMSTTTKTTSSTSTFSKIGGSTGTRTS